MPEKTLSILVKRKPYLVGMIILPKIGELWACNIPFVPRNKSIIVEIIDVKDGWVKFTFTSHSNEEWNRHCETMENFLWCYVFLKAKNNE